MRAPIPVSRPLRSRNGNRRPGFKLVYLLAVIAVIGLFVALILPAT